jgi:hypothetical protein
MNDGKECGMYGGELKCRQGFWWGILNERNHFCRPKHRLEENIKMDLK